MKLLLLLSLCSIHASALTLDEYMDMVVKKNRLISSYQISVEASQEKWAWSFHKNSQDLLANRVAALNGFLADYEAGKKVGRYQLEELPQLSFADREFDLALCSHLLFLYSNLLSFDFHLASLLELCRAANEVRVFPVLDLLGNISIHLDPICLALQERGIKTSLEKVNYEFQKGGHQMLRISYEKNR